MQSGTFYYIIWSTCVGSIDLELPQKAARDGSVESEKNVAVILNFFDIFA